jgi:hypothetical protein
MRMDSIAIRAGRVTRRGFPGRAFCGLAVALAAVSLLASCASEPVADTPSPADLAGPAVGDVVVHDSLSAEVGYSDRGTPLPDTTALRIGFVRPEHRHLAPGERPQTEEVRLDNGMALSWYLILGSGEPTILLVTALLDYQQVPFTLDGEHGLLHEVRVGPTGDLEMPMRLEIGEPGAHDLLVVAFKEPYSRPMDADYRNRLFQRLVSRRAVLTVGGVEQPVHQPTPDLVGALPPSDITFGIPVCFGAAADGTAAHPARRFLWSVEGLPKETVSFRLWVSNYHGQLPIDGGLVLFQDFHQVPLRGKEFLIVHLEPGHEAIIDGNLGLPGQPGVHEVQALLVIDPYRSIQRDEVSDLFVRGSNCLGVQVRH